MQKNRKQEKPKINPAFLAVGALLLIVLAGFIFFRQATTPGETITDFKKVPPKGAGRFDRD